MIAPAESAIPSRSSVLRYLHSRGWQSRKSKDGRLVRAYLPGAGDDEEEIELLFTSSDDDRAKDSEVAAAIRTIAQLYELSVEAATRSVGALPFDLVFGRIPNEYVRNESVELGLATSYISGMKSFLAASATTELTGMTSFKRTRKEAIDYASSCRFAHTFRGSFGFVIESPVGLNDAPSIPVVEEAVPFERKVMERIARGFQSFNTAVATDDAAPIANERGGFSANMCDELIGVLEDTAVSRLDISLQLSPEWRSALTEKVPTVSIEKRYLDVLRDASTRLRREEAPEKETIVGRVVRLEAEGNPSDLLADVTDREVLISWDSPEYGLVRVQALLSPKGYLEAVEAHKVGGLVRLTGMLQRKGRGWQLTAIPNGPLDVAVVA